MCSPVAADPYSTTAFSSAPKAACSWDTNWSSVICAIESPAPSGTTAAEAATATETTEPAEPTTTPAEAPTAPAAPASAAARERNNNRQASTAPATTAAPSATE